MKSYNKLKDSRNSHKNLYFIIIQISLAVYLFIFKHASDIKYLDFKINKNIKYFKKKKNPN